MGVKAPYSYEDRQRDLANGVDPNAVPLAAHVGIILLIGAILIVGVFLF